MKHSFLTQLSNRGKLAFSLLASSLLFTHTPVAYAVDVKVEGKYDFTYQVDTLGFEGKSSNQAQQRIRLGIELAVDESLSGYLQTEVRWEWGTNYNPIVDEGNTAAYDGAYLKTYLRLGYIDWKIPSTDIKVRIGRHKYSLPAYATSSGHIEELVSDGILIAAPINDTFTINAFWSRLAQLYPEHKAWTTNNIKKYDIFGLVGTGKFETVTASAWAVYAAKGKGIDSSESEQSAILNKESKGDIITGGFGVEWNPVDPLTISADFAVGRANFTHAPDQKGWYAVGKIAYALDFGTPAIRGWYSSGDKKGKYLQGIFPSIYGDLYLTNTYYDGMENLGLGKGPYNCVFYGSWGISLMFEEITFVKDLTHLISATYMSGTNNKYNTADTDPSWYMTTKDHAWEFDFLTTYKLYKNLTVGLELGYIVQDFDTSEKYGRANMDFKNAFRTAMFFSYKF